jgi:hypothetical protein
MRAFWLLRGSPVQDNVPPKIGTHTVHVFLIEYSGDTQLVNTCSYGHSSLNRFKRVASHIPL